jgi:hypothetical protein
MSFLIVILLVLVIDAKWITIWSGITIRISGLGAMRPCYTKP